MTAFELMPEGGTRQDETAEPFVWSTGKGVTSSVEADVGAWLSSLGPLPPAAIDFVRIAAGAYMADRRSSRGVGFSRTIDLRVQLVDSAQWAGLAEPVADLLFWLTGDVWRLELTDDGLAVPAAADPPEPVSTVALLSGGLDSFCGAVLAGPAERLFMGQWDSPTIKGAQNRVGAWLEDAFGVAVAYEQIKLTQSEKKKEGSSRSRSLLFLALASALAEARGAETVEVPENGYTSLNPGLGPERGGALTTRSTHPMTIARVNDLLAELGLSVRIADPYLALTKGELLQEAARAGVDGFLDGCAVTLSCGKLDGGWYRGGNANHHCGLCYPCLVRRAGFVSSGIDDRTVYLSDTLAGDSLLELRLRRASDMRAVARATGAPFDDASLMASGPFPDDFDFDAAVDLCERGLRELSLVAGL